MNNKPKAKSWAEVQMAISAVAITTTLVLWNMFASPDKNQAVAQAQATPAPTEPPAPEEATPVPAPTASFTLRPVKIIFGGTAPQQQIVQVSASNPTSKKKNNTNKNPAPAPSNPPPSGSSK